MKNSKEIVKASENLTLPLSEWSGKLITDIASEVKCRVLDVGTKFFEIGYLLNLIRHKVFSLEDRFLKYENFYDWAEKELGFKRTTVKNLMAINATYSDHSVSTAGTNYNYIGATSSTFSPVIDEKWRGYTQTALVEMLPMTAEERKTISKETSISEIRALKKKSESNGQSTDQENNTIIIDSEPSDEDLPETITVAEIDSAVTNTKKLLNLKNVKERQAWIENYRENCYLWLDVPALNAKFYRYDFANGVYLLVTEHKSTVYAYTNFGCYVTYQLIGESDIYPVSKYWGYSILTKNSLIDYLTKYKGAV